MASAFWRLEDGRTFAIRWVAMAYILKLITDELKTMKGTKDFHEYLEQFVFKEDIGDMPNGYGGFIRGNDDILFNIDLRTYTPENRLYFWKAAQKALSKLMQESNDDPISRSLITLLDMHKRIKRVENPMLLNHLIRIEPETNEKLGPGW